MGALCKMMNDERANAAEPEAKNLSTKNTNPVKEHARARQHE